MSARLIDDDSHEQLISIDASKRARDERLNKVMNQFSSKGSKHDDDDDGGNSKKNNSKSSSRKNYADDDDDDDIVAMMDRMNK